MERMEGSGRFAFANEAKETKMSDLYPVANPRPWGASLTISTIVILAYLALSLYFNGLPG